MQDGNGERQGAIEDVAQIVRMIRALVERNASGALIEHELDRLDAALAAFRVAWDRGGEGPGGKTAGQGDQPPGEG